MKELYHVESDHKIVPLGVKIGVSSQKFKIPFKNLSYTQEGEFEFTFVKLHNNNTD